MAAIRKRKKKLQGSAGCILPILGCVCVLFFVMVFVMYSVLEDNDMLTLQFMQHDGQDGQDDGGRRRRRRGPDEGGVRQRYEKEHPLTEDEIRSGVEKMRLSTPIGPVKNIQTDLQYDVHRCPPEVPDDYPLSWNILEVLDHWNPDETEVPEDGIYQGLCVIDWSDHEQRKVAYRYQKAELPFLIHNHSQIWKTSERWSHYDYMHEMVGDDSHRNEHNPLGNHMMFWKLGRGASRYKPAGWKPPTENVELSFPDWYAKALNVENSNDPVHTEHYYLRLNGLFEHDHGYLYDELPFFAPTEKSLFMVEPDEARGINCRFGSKGIIAETHYDMSRNMILILHGRKRYILAHPEECQNMELHPMGHPSARHSKVNWSDPQSWKTGNFPKGLVNEVVLQAGDALYLPTYWFHFIVSLNLNYQCNARSGITYENEDYIRECGFG